MAELKLDTYETLVPNAIYTRKDEVNSRYPYTEVRALRVFTHHTSFGLISRISGAAMAAKTPRQQYYPRLAKYLETLPDSTLEALQRSGSTTPEILVDCLPEFRFKPSSKYLSSTYGEVSTSSLATAVEQSQGDEEETARRVLDLLYNEEVLRKSMHVRLTRSGSFPNESTLTLVQNDDLIVNGKYLSQKELDEEINLASQAAKFSAYLFDETDLFFEKVALAVVHEFANELELRVSR